MKIGEILFYAREGLGISEKEAARAIQVSVRTLAALERGEKEHLPPPVYVRGFVKRYAAYLGLSEEEYKKAFEAEWSEETYEELRPFFFQAARFVSSLINYHRITVFAFLAVFLGIGLYFAYQFRFVVGAPTLMIDFPPPELFTEDRRITVRGRAELSSEVFVNGRRIPVDAQGNFYDSALLRAGLNALDFEVINRLEKTKRETRHVLVR